jgi:hypothetical protein
MQVSIRLKQILPHGADRPAQIIIKERREHYDYPEGNQEDGCDL